MSLRRLLGIAAAASVLAWGPPAWGAPYEKGETVVITGVVTDRQGTPLNDVRVVLESARAGFSFLKLGRVIKDRTRVSAPTDERGEYTIHWPWNDYHNRFALLVAVPVRRADGEQLEILERVDLTDRVLQGSPVVSTVTVEDTRFLESQRQFLASIRSPDQRQVHREMGRPDRFERIEFPDHEEASWWYFASGRAYRFRDGHLEKIVPFEPVRPIRDDRDRE